MSGNQSRFEKSDTRKVNRSAGNVGNYQRSYSNKNPGAASGPIPPIASNRNYNKTNSVQGGQSGANSYVTVVAPPQTQHNIQQQHVHGTAGSAVSDVSSRTSEASASSQRSNQPVPKTPTSQSPAMSSDAKSATPVKDVAAKPVAVQFGSISPGFVNGMQIPARTSSAPPNMDEQKRNQARIESFRPVRNSPVPAVPKQQQLPEKEAGPSKPVQVVESHSASSLKKENSVFSSPSSSIPQRPSSIPMSGTHQQQVRLPYGVPTPPVQSQVVPGASMNMPFPMHYHMGNASQLQPHMFMPNIQPHPMQHQVLMHQGHVMNFPSQMGPPIPYQLGNLGMSAPQPYPMMQGGKISAPRKAVVITHPDTRQELKLDKRGDKHGEGGLPLVRPNLNAPAKSQNSPAYTANPAQNYRPNTYSSSPYFGTAVSISSTRTQESPSFHALKSNPVSQASPVIGHEAPSFGGKVIISVPATKEALKTDQGHDTQGVSAAGPASSKSTSGSNTVSGQGDSTKLIAQGDVEKDVFKVELDKANLNQDSTENSMRKPGKKVNDLPVPTLSLSSEIDNKSDVSTLKTVDDKLAPESPSKNQTSSQGHPLSNELKDPKQLSRSTDEVTEQKDELITHSTEEQEGSTNIQIDSGTFATNDDLLATESKQKNVVNIDLNNHEINMKSDIPTDLSLRDMEGDVKKIVGVVHSLPVTGSKDTVVPDPCRPKSASSKGKKKMKEMLQKADAAGATFDIYKAYKAPEEHKEADLATESEETCIGMDDTKTMGRDVSIEASDTRSGGSRSKDEPDDWEDAADVGTPDVRTPDYGEHQGILIQHDSEILFKKYSKDFLLKFQSQNYNLPEGFSVVPSVANILLIPSADRGGHHGRDILPSPGRHTGGSRLDRHGPGMYDDRWNKGQGNFVPSRDYANSAGGFKHAQGGNSSVLKYPRQGPSHVTGVNHSGPPLSINSIHRNNTEADRWQRGSNFQGGLIPSPQTPSQVMHKAEKKYEVGKVADEEQTKQRRLKGILNKLTPQNFEKLFEQVKAVNIDSAVTLTGVISQIFDKALTEPTFCEMYADFCYHLSGELPNFGEANEKITFKRVLLNKCQEEFERGEREQEEANRSEESEITQTKEEREERRVQARRRMLGNIRLIGELFKKKMLTERIMHECIKKLLGQHENPDEEDLEALCKLMSTIGEMIDHHVAKPFMDVYFGRMGDLSVDMNLSSRVRFMLKDTIDLRINRWQQRRKVEGPKKIEDVHKDAAHERQAQASRLARGPSINASGRRVHQSDFGSRGSNTMPSPSSHSVNIRGYPSQSRGYGNHDIRAEDRQPLFESRTLVVPLRTAKDETTTLGPHGGLARGMSSRGSGTIASAPLIDRPISSGESRNTEGRYNGNKSVTERPASSSSEDTVGRPGPERRAILGTHVSGSESSDRTSLTSPKNTFSEERLQEMSLAAIKEFYSAKDEKELTLCIYELNSTSFYPTMISLWVTDSFERKDMHRDLLTSLLINLSKPSSGVLSHQDLIKGFELVLSTLDDAVNDAPRAPEFLGHILAKTITENVIPLRDISHILHEGGEEPGTLLESGLAGDLLGIILESFQAEKGDAFLDQILTSSHVRLQDFQPPGPMKSKKLAKFIK